VLLKDIKPGTQAQISYIGAAAATTGPFITRVEVVESERTILLHEPFDKGRRIKFVERNTYKLCFICDGAQVNFEAKFMELVKIDGFHLLRFFMVTDGEKVQRRNSFRFTCSLLITFNIVYDNGDQGTKTEGLVRDLSSGGIKMLTKLNVPENALLRIDLFLDDDYVMAFGQVRMKRHVPENVKYPYTYGISFEAMPESEEERIVRYVYNEQRKLLKKPQRALYKTNKK
jgi:c-di-GMP-binding flagellar brake protein YcgR